MPIASVSHICLIEGSGSWLVQKSKVCVTGLAISSPFRDFWSWKWPKINLAEKTLQQLRYCSIFSLSFTNPIRSFSVPGLNHSWARNALVIVSFFLSFFLCFWKQEFQQLQKEVHVASVSSTNFVKRASRKYACCCNHLFRNFTSKSYSW